MKDEGRCAYILCVIIHIYRKYSILKNLLISAEQRAKGHYGGNSAVFTHEQNKCINRNITRYEPRIISAEAPIQGRG